MAQPLLDGGADPNQEHKQTGCTPLMRQHLLDIIWSNSYLTEGRILKRKTKLDQLQYTWQQDMDIKMWSNSSLTEEHIQMLLIGLEKPSLQTTYPRPTNPGYDASSEDKNENENLSLNSIEQICLFCIVSSIFRHCIYYIFKTSNDKSYLG